MSVFDFPGSTSVCGQGRSLRGGCQAVTADAQWAPEQPGATTSSSSSHQKSQGTLYGRPLRQNVTDCEAPVVCVVCVVSDKVVTFESAANQAFV